MVANARNLAYITRSSRKSHKVDAESLARLEATDLQPPPPTLPGESKRRKA